MNVSAPGQYHLRMQMGSRSTLSASLPIRLRGWY